jgi:hypothetical protein
MKTKYGHAGIDSHGYYKITSRKEGNHNRFLHRLIWEDVNGKVPNGYEIHHIDDNPLNNEISNLKCLSKFEHMSLHKKRLIGEKNSNSKLNESQVWTIKRMLDLNYTVKHIARVFGVHISTIYRISYGKRWGHVKYPS